MYISSKKNRDFILKELGEEGILLVNQYLEENNKNIFHDIKSDSDLVRLMMTIPSNISFSEKELLKNYTGINFSYINSYIRYGWIYERHGKYDKDKENILEQTIEDISNVISKASACGMKFNVYRGINYHYFSDYGINSINDLIGLKGQFINEIGFVSTSIDRDYSFFGKKFENGLTYDVEIMYHIDGDYNDGIFIFDNSWNPKEKEFLIGNFSFSYINDVIIKDDKAYIDASLIPMNLVNRIFNNNRMKR